MIIDELMTVDDITQAKQELREIRNIFFLKNKRNTSKYKTPEEVDMAIEKLENIPVIKTTLAFYPEESFIREIVKKIREASSMPAVIDLDIDANIIGGLTISYLGKYQDLSLRKKINEL